jgi:TonB-dependent starch-binding outer membrane protein SusC
MKRSVITFTALLAFQLLLVFELYGQNALSGHVYDGATQEPLIGATVVIKGTTIGTVTNIDGFYSVTSSVDTGTLIFSFIGYVPQETSFSSREQTFDISLIPDLATLEEVVVVAYGTQKKSHLTGAVSSLKNDGLDEIAVSRADQALVGKLAGVQILNLDPEAGAAPSIRVRGMGSISANNDPLIVIDGYPMPKGEDAMSMVSMGDVQSIEVLKDAASSALYGSRAAGGVILITTKSGSNKKTRYNFKMYSGITKPIKLPDMMSTEDYVELLYSEEALRMQDPSVDGTSATMEFNNVFEGEQAAYLISKYVDDEPTDWPAEALRDYGKINSYQLSASGGGENVQYFISGNFNSEEGNMKKSSYDKYSFRGKVDMKLSERVKVGFNVSPTYSKRERPEGSLTDYIRFQSWVPIYHNEATAAMTGGTFGEYSQPFEYRPTTITGVGVNGEIWNVTSANPWGSGNNNPVSVRERTSRIDDNYKLASNMYLSVDIFPGLQFKTSNGAYYSYNEYNLKEQTNSGQQNDVNRLTREMLKYTDLLTENTLSYNKTMGNHDLGVLAGFTAQKSSRNFNKMEGTNFVDEEIMAFNLVGTMEKAVYDQDNEIPYYSWALMSWLGRVTYAYQGKYLASAAIRADGSTKFAEGHQWGTFPSASIGWRVSEEDFLKNSNYISNLKVRASWGITGNNAIPSYAYMNTVSTTNPELDYGSKEYSFGSGNGNVYSGITATDDVLGNPEISWEQLEETNLGLDMGFVKNRYNISVEYYNSVSKELLLEQPTMAVTGHKKAWNNIGKVNNKGVEIDIKANVISRKDFTWIISGNISHNKNTLVNYGGQDKEDRQGERNVETFRAEVGSEAIQFYGYKTDGLWETFEELEAAESGSMVYITYVPTIGGVKVLDIDGNDTINSDDRAVIGSPYPDFTWAVTNSFTYKNFDASFLWQGSQGGELMNGDPYYIETMRYNRAYTENHYVSPMFPGDGQTVNGSTTAGSLLMQSDYIIEDASYISLREISVGYTLPNNIAKLLHLNNLRAYVSATNLIYIMGSNYRGVNPEARQTGTTNGVNYDDPLIDGYQRGVFPQSKSFIFGLDITF